MVSSVRVGLCECGYMPADVCCFSVHEIIHSHYTIQSGYNKVYTVHDYSDYTCTFSVHKQPKACESNNICVPVCPH